MWEALWYLTGVNPYDHTTYREIYRMRPLHSMVYQHYIGHSQYLWDIRQNPGVVEAFATIYGTWDLLVSYDGASILFPPEITGRGWHRNDWYHCDQSYSRTNFECAQGWVTLYDVREMDATLSVLEGSHHYHDEFASNFGLPRVNKDWYQLPVGECEEMQFYRSRGCSPTRVVCPAGSLVVWDSRVVHTGKGVPGGRTNNYQLGVPPEVGIRSVAYVSMQPRWMCGTTTLRKRVSHYERGRMTNHWASRPKLVSVEPRNYGGEERPEVRPLPTRPLLTPLGRRLVGYEGTI